MSAEKILQQDIVVHDLYLFIYYKKAKNDIINYNVYNP